MIPNNFPFYAVSQGFMSNFRDLQITKYRLSMTQKNEIIFGKGRKHWKTRAANCRKIRPSYPKL